MVHAAFAPRMRPRHRQCLWPSPQKKRQQIFGLSSTAYDHYYTPKPYSKKHVIHLDTWYAQSHPDEDFAETFAVWLTPRSAWKKRYRNWPVARKKLEYIDALMTSIAGQKPKSLRRTCIEPQQKIGKSLKQHYQEKQRYYGLSFPKIYDVQLYALFTNSPTGPKPIKAATFIRKIRKQVRRAVAPWTGTYQYNIQQLLDEIIAQTAMLDLYLHFEPDETKNQFISMITLVTLEYIHSGNHKKAR